MTAGIQEAMRRGGLKAGVRFIRYLYDRGRLRDIRSAGEWYEMLGYQKGLPSVLEKADLQVHHLIERRFAERLGLKPNDIPAVVLDRTFHEQQVNARLFSKEFLPTGQEYRPQDIWNAYRRLYTELGHPEWLEAIWPYFERWGVQR